MSISPVTYYGIVIVLFLLGTFIGRFLNRCVSRLPQEFYAWPAWRVVFRPEERKGIYPATRWYHWLPVVGTALIVGRSPYSGRRVLRREPWLELLNGGLFVLTFLCCWPPEAWGGLDAATVMSPLNAARLFGWQSTSQTFVIARFVYFLLLFEFLFVATMIDFDLWIIPDGVTVPGMIVGVCGQILGIGFFIAPVWFQDPDFLRLTQQLIPLFEYWPSNNFLPQWMFTRHYLHAAAVSGLGFLVGGGIVWAVRIFGGWALKREAMGFGDVILMAMMGTFVGWQATILIFFLAPMMALIVLLAVSILRFLSVLKIPPSLPYGPYLSLACLFVVLAWRSLWPVVERIFALGPFLIVVSLLMLLIFTSILVLMQLLRKLLGISYEEEQETNWRPADQLLYLAGENFNPRQGLWKRSEWPGISAGTGRSRERDWRL